MGSKDKQILGPDGCPIGNKNDEIHLPVEIQALVEARVNTAMDSAREILRSDVISVTKSNDTRALIRYVLLLIANAIIGVWLWVYGPAEVRDWTHNFVAENMNKPTLESAAQEVVAEKMETFATEKIKPLSEQFVSLNTAITDAEKTLKKLQDEQYLISLVNRAETFDKDAIGELEALSKGTSEMAPLALSMLNKVQRSLILDRGAITSLIPIERKGGTEYTGPFTNDELAVGLLYPIPDGAVNLIGDQKNLLFVPRLVEIARSSKDLWTINRVSKALKNIVNIDFFPWDLKPLDEWWARNATKYKGWPYTEYFQAVISFKTAKYSEALQAFEAVLDIDPAADRSRALAVACAIELGDLPKAQKLNVGYSQKEGRWELWAKCKMLLRTDTAERATEEFAKLAKKFPTFTDQAWIQEGNPVLMNLDWPLYYELMKSSDQSDSNK